MGWYESDVDYYEPSEFEEECEHLKQLLRESVDNETKRKIEHLEAENAKMKKVYDNYESKVRELEEVKSKLKREKEDMKMAVKKECLSALLGPYKDYLYEIGYETYQKEKCDRCDENRQIHFKSPQGKNCKEDCICAKLYRKYFVRRSKMVFLRINEYSHALEGYYCEEERWQNDDNEYRNINSDRVKERLYDGRPFNKIKDFYMVYFKTEEEAQNYADWLNKKEEK